MHYIKIFFFRFFVFLSFTIFGQSQISNDIQEAFQMKESIKVLNLSGQLDFVLPENISDLENLEELNLSETNIIKLPAGLVNCKKLKKINLSYNPNMDVNQVCDVLRNLQITSLSLEGCQLAFIPFQVSEILSLNFLNVSNNLIYEFPDNFGKLVNLVQLDVAMNQLDSVAFGLNSLPKLKAIDFSFNTRIVIDHLISSGLDFPALEEIKLIGVRDFPATLNLREGRLKKLDLSNTSFENLNQHTTDSFKVDHFIAKNCKKLDYDFVCKTLQNSGVKKLEISDKKMENIPVGIRRMKDLEELVVEETQINYVPSLNNHKNLRRITFGSNNLNTIFSSVSRLNNLEYLNIKATGIDNSEVEKLVEHFPNTEIVYNPQKQGVPLKFPEYLKDLNYTAPFISLVKGFERFKFSGKDNAEIKLTSGTLIKIDNNSLLTPDGKAYLGEVNLKVKEYKNSLDVYLSGLPMFYDSNAVYGFESAGMYQIEATTFDGETLELADKKPLTINTNIPQNNTGFQSYTLESGKWVNNGTTPSFPYSFEPIGLYSTIRKVKQEKKPELKHQEFGIEVWKTKDVKSFRLRFIGKGFSKLNLRTFSNKKISINEFTAFANEKWIVVDSDAEEKLKLLQRNKEFNTKDVYTPFSSDNPKILFKGIQDVKLEPQYEKDNFLLTIVTTSSTIQLNIIQDFSRVGPKSSKRKLRSAWKRYEIILKSSKEKNKVLLQNYEDLMKQYQALKTLQYNDSVFKANNPDGFAEQQKARKDYQSLKNGIFASVALNADFNIRRTGFCNIDRIIKDLESNGLEFVFESYNEKGDSLELEHISILSSAYSSAIKYIGNTFTVNKMAKSLAIGKTKDGNLAYISKSDFMRALSSNNKVKKLKFTLVDPKEIEKEELAKIIAK